MRTTILGGRDPQGRPVPKYIKAISPSLIQEKKGMEKGGSKD
jgi:hypothetical protein